MNQPSSPLPLSECPSTGGAYVLEICVREPLSLRVGRLGSLGFEPGRYLYVGSAYGPGGLAARVRRHLKSTKNRLHWHVDYLSSAIGVDKAWVIPHGNECELTSALLSAPTTSVPFVGFGSSDCNRCDAHLLLDGGRLNLVELLSDGGNRAHFPLVF